MSVLRYCRKEAFRPFIFLSSRVREMASLHLHFLRLEGLSFICGQAKSSGTFSAFAISSRVDAAVCKRFA
ncbi:hypothetical protein NMG60_11034065 [Bertholletia excelsa]